MRNVLKVKRFVFTLMTIASFIMLSALTWGLNPLTKIAESITKKYEREALTKVCSRVRQMEEVYMLKTKYVFELGCILDVFNFNIMLNPKKRDELSNCFDKTKSCALYEEASRYCSKTTAAAFMDDQVREEIVLDLRMRLECDRLDGLGDLVEEP